jgi:RHS repeat-associated protein
MTALLKNGSGPTATPISGVSVSFTVTGPNATTGSATTNATGAATFTYTGANSGTDTVTASYAGQNSNSANVSWLVPSKPISTGTVTGMFFPSDLSGVFNTPPTATPTFVQSFPTITFDPPTGVLAGNTSGVNTATHPFTDVVIDSNGNFVGTLIAQGNGVQANGLLANGSAGPLFAFQAVLRGTLTVASAGSVSLTIYADDGYILGIGGGASRVSGPMINVPANGLTPFSGYTVIAANNQGHLANGDVISINFPAPGSYPYELDYTDNGAGGSPLNAPQDFLSLTMVSGTGSSNSGLPPSGSLTLSPTNPSALATGQTQTFTATVTDATGAGVPNATVALNVGGANQRQLTANTDSTGHATFQYTGTNAGADSIQASANVSGMGTFSNQIGMTWTVPSGGGGGTITFVPQGWIGSPGIGTVVQGQVPITVASGITLTTGTLTFWPTSNPGAITTLNSNTTGSGTIGTFDGTTLASGGYTIQLNATASSGATQVSQITVSVVGNNKPGRMTSTVTEFKVPLAGIPISITRTYDSLDRGRIEDFGFGWRLGTFIDLSVDAQNNVTFNFNGQKVTFFFTPQPIFLFGSWLTPAYTPQAGVHGSLASNGCAQLLNLQGSLVCFPSTGQTYQPTLYAYTDPVGRTYTITSSGQLQSIQDLNGNTITVTPTGITSSVNGVVVPFVRDGSGRISQITDLNGKIYTYTYDTSGNLQSVQYPGLAAAETYTYATDHSLLTEKDPNGNTSTATYYSSANDGGNSLLDGRLKSVTGPSVSDANGNPTQYTTQYSYNPSTNTTTITNPDGGTVTRTDDSFGNPLTVVESVTSSTMRTTTYQYDANENLVKVIRPCGNTACSDTTGNDTYIYTYDANGFQTSIQDPLGASHTSRKTYNSVGGVLTATDAANTNTQTTTYDANFNPSQTTDLLNGAGTATLVSSYTFDALGNVLTSTDANSKTTQYAYDPSGNLIQVTDALGEITHYGYDLMNRLVSQTDPRGHNTTFTYDALGRLTKKTDALQNQTIYVYDDNGNKISETDANNHKTQYQYDAMNRMTKITYPDTTIKQYRYDFRGNKVVEIDQLNHQTVSTYDLAGELLSVTSASGTLPPDQGTINYTYDLDGRVVTVKDELNNPTTTNTYDAAGNLSTVKDALNNVTTYSYDADNRKTTVQNANHNTTSYAYDPRSRLTTITYPIAPPATQPTTTQYTYDGMGRQLTTTDQAGMVTTKTYDAVGRLSSVKDAIRPTPNVTNYFYDLTGNLRFLQDAAGRVTAYEYDPLNRRTTRTLPRSQFESYSYDPVGNLATKSDFNGLKTTYTYDTLNRLLSKVPSSGTGISFTYTATGQRLSMTDPSGTTNYTSYDNRDRLKTKATPEGTLTYTYDAHGNVLTINSSNTNGASMTYTYDALNRLASAKDNRIAAQGGPSTPTTYTYDPVGNLLNYTYPNTVQTANVFDPLNRLTQTCSATSSPACSASSKLASYAYTLGAAGNRKNVLELNSRNVAYGYDNDYRLQSEAVTADPSGKNGTVSYVYDVVGNRASMTSTLNAVPGGSFFYDNNDQLTTDTYDNNGNTTASAGISNTYDFENRMIGHGAVALVYDGDGNRVTETIGGTTTKYLIDDLNPIHLPQVLDEIVNGSITRTYAYGKQRISENQLVNGTWTPSFYGYDGHGNVRFLTNPAGTITDSYDYDAFGMPIRNSGATPNIFLYSGERLDSSVGLYDLRERYYNQATGRFSARDPEEGATCTPLTQNSYIYGIDDPVDRADPTGRAALADYEIATVSGPASPTVTAAEIGWNAVQICLLTYLFTGVHAAYQHIGAPQTFSFNFGLCYIASKVPQPTPGPQPSASPAGSPGKGPPQLTPPPPTCANTYPMMLSCEGLPQGYKFGSFEDARDAVGAYLQRQVDKARNQPKDSTEGPCVGIGGKHYSTTYTDGGPRGYPASIGCCRCCSDASGTPDPTQTRCKVLNVDNHKTPPSPPF